MMKTLILATAAWALRFAAKIYELILCSFNFLHQSSDPTQILLKHFTPAQKDADAAAAKLMSTHEDVKLLVVIPFRDRWPMTKRCLDAVLAQRFSFPLRIVLADNGSVEEQTRRGLLSFLEKHPDRLQLVTLNYAFNFSRINNDSVDSAADFAASHILFLNNDVILRDETSLTQLLKAFSFLPRTGALGCTLLYEDETIQHLFVAPGVKLVAAHPLKRRKWDKNWVWFAKPRPVAAVTGALMLVSAADFKRVGRFDPGLAYASQDVDLCLKFQKYGLINWTLAPLTAFHLEGASRGHGHDPNEVTLMYARWGKELTANPYYSGKFSRWSESPLIRLLGEPSYPWQLILRALPSRGSS